MIHFSHHPLRHTIHRHQGHRRNRLRAHQSKNGFRCLHHTFHLATYFTPGRRPLVRTDSSDSLHQMFAFWTIINLNMLVPAATGSFHSHQPAAPRYTTDSTAQALENQLHHHLSILIIFNSINHDHNLECGQP